MATRKITQVRKRDGRVVHYDERRIADAIHRAALSAGQDNRYLAEDLAGVVTLYLERYYEGDLPSSGEIQQMIEKILFETGHAGIAKAYLLYRENKGRIAEPAPPPPAEELFPENRILVDGLARDEVSAWGRDRISSALVKEAGLEPSSAEEVAAAVERKIFGLGQRRVSTVQIRDLVNHELLLRGYGSKVARQLVVGLPKYDLGRLLEPGTPDADALVRTIGETTLKQYALQEVLSREVAEAHLEGRIHEHDLEHPLKLAWVGLSLDELPRIPELPAESARTLSARIARARQETDRRAVRVEALGLNAAFGPLARQGDHEEAMHLLLALGDWVPGLDLSREEGFSMAFLRALRERGGRIERVFQVNGKSEPLSEACRQAVEGAPTLFLLERDPAPRRSRFGRAPAVVQATSINLPQAFFRDETDFYAELEQSLDLAVQSHLDRRRLMQRAAVGPDGATYAVGLVGLEDLVRALCGNAPAGDEGALKLALRIVSYVYFRIREESAKHSIAMSLEDVPSGSAPERLFRIDTQMHPRARGMQVDRYAPGFHLREGDAATRLGVESRFHTLIPSGRACLPVSGRTAADLESLLLEALGKTLTQQVQTIPEA